MKVRTIGRRLGLIFFNGTLIAVLALTVLAARIWTFDARWAASPPVDAAIVLGAGAPRGTPSPVFAARLDYAATLWRSGAVRFVIVTGGGRDDPSNPEAVAGLHYLLSMGLPGEALLFEARSISTPENLCFGVEVGSAKGLHSYAIVSDPLHLARSMKYASDLALDARPAGTPTTRFVSLRTRIPFLLAETYKYAKRLLGGPVHCPPRQGASHPTR